MRALQRYLNPQAEHRLEWVPLALRLTVMQGLRPVAAGLVIGLVLTFWLSGLMSSLLFNVTPTDPWTYGVVTIAMILTAAGSCYLPARQVLKVDPTVALRTE